MQQGKIIRRNKSVKAMFDPDLPFRPRVMRDRKNDFKRNPKHRQNYRDERESDRDV